MISFEVFDTIYSYDMKTVPLIGTGSHGKVCYLGEINNIKMAIKVSSDSLSTEKYFYDKSKGANALPNLYAYGKFYNDNSAELEYVVMEYVGMMSLTRLFNILKNSIDDEDAMIIKMIYYSLYYHTKALHTKNVAFRDMSPNNVVISDKLLSYFAHKYYSVGSSITKNFTHLIQKNVTYESILRDFFDKKYSNIARFVDTGMMCDLDEFDNIQMYNEKNVKIYGYFSDFMDMDSLFSSTPHYISPFVLLNISSSLYKCQPDNLKTYARINIKRCLRIADFWGLNLIFYVFMYNVMNPVKTHEHLIACRRDAIRKTGTYHEKYELFAFESKISPKGIYMRDELVRFEYVVSLQFVSLKQNIVNIFRLLIQTVNNISMNGLKYTKRVHIDFSSEKVMEYVHDELQTLEIYISSELSESVSTFEKKIEMDMIMQILQ
jgi:serine/threonine protein kinase